MTDIIIIFFFIVDLLQFKENPNMRERPAKNYPRPDWFYLEDNALEDAELPKQDV